MNPIMSDLRAANAIRAHKDQSLRTGQRPSRTRQPKGESLPAAQRVRGRVVDVFSSIGRRLQHGHV
jgi:hypothetical protein